MAVCLLFVLGATWVSYRDMQTTRKSCEYWLVGFQVVVLVLFAVAALVEVANGNAFDATAIELSWFNPFAVKSRSRPSPPACRSRSSSSGAGT